MHEEHFIKILNLKLEGVMFHDEMADVFAFLNLKGSTLTSTNGKSSIYHVTLSLGNIDIKNMTEDDIRKISITDIYNFIF